MYNIIYVLLAVVICFVLGAYTQKDKSVSAREIIYDLSCAPTAALDVCVGIVGNVPKNVFDTSRVCLKESSVRCDQRYGRYGLALRTKERVSSLDAAGSLVYQLQNEGKQITIPLLRHVGDQIYLLWMEEPYRIRSESSSRLMYMARPVRGGISDWSTPTVLFDDSTNTMTPYETAIERRQVHSGEAALHVLITAHSEERERTEMRHGVLRNGAVAQRSTIGIRSTGEEEIEVVGDSLYLAFVGTIGTHTPKLARSRSRVKPDRNNVFVVARHLDEEEWSPARLIANTEENYAHYITAVAHDSGLQIGFVEQAPDYSHEQYRQYTIGSVEPELTYPLSGNIQRRRTFQTIPGLSGVLIRAWKGRITEFHLLRSADAASQVIRTELSEMSATYYMVGQTPHVSYIAIKRARPPVDLEIRTVRFDR